MSYEAVCWALYRAPWLLTPSGEPDITARFVLIARAERADAKGRDTYAGPADVAAATGFDERTVRKADRRLEAAGLLIRDGKSRYGTVLWHCDMTKDRTVTADRSPIDERAERKREANRERQRRFQAARKAAAARESEPEASAESIEGDVSSKIQVTPLKSVSNGVEERDVTPSKNVTNALHAPQTTLLTTQLNHPGTTPGGAPPPDPRRRPPPSASATYERESPCDPPTPAQDQQGESLPHASARAPAPPRLADVVDIETFRRTA